MTPGHAAFALLAANPIGGLLVAIPFSILKLHDPVWLAVAAGVPLAYLQVVAVDLGWMLLSRAAWWNALLERRRSRWAERLLESRGGFWITFAASPFIGPWLVMAFMPYARVPHRRVALPIALSISCTAMVLGAACAWLPAVFQP